MEPLAHSIRINPVICGIEIGELNHKIGLYADDVIVSITNPTQSLPHLQHTLDLFSKASLFKINYSESCMFGDNIDPNTKRSIEQHNSFSWAPDSLLFRYLLDYSYFLPIFP